MVQFWTNFAAFGNPFIADGTLWFPFVRRAGNMVNLYTPRDSNFTTFNTEHECAFWDALLTPPTPMAAPDPRHPAVRGR
jgi:hypothetical protein